jgi:RNA polymerase sigma-70 factor (ECF subfamily)
MSDSVPTLQYWLDRLREGDPEARNELIGHSRNRFRLLTRQMMRSYPRVREWEETSDVLQNVLVRLDRALQAIVVETPEDLTCLAATQIRRELIDLSRRHFGPLGAGRHLVSPGHDEAFPEPADRAADPSDLAKWCALHEYLANLPDDERRLWDVKYYQGLTDEQAAALLGMSLRTFQRRWPETKIETRIAMGDDWPL